VPRRVESQGTEGGVLPIACQLPLCFVCGVLGAGALTPQYNARNEQREAIRT
jgi:hypothetical protein